VPTTPLIVAQPTNFFARLGANATNRIVAVSSSPLQYQWNSNGTHLAGATNALLVLSNVQLSHRGSYTVIASNSFGVAVSQPVLFDIFDEPRIVLQPLSQMVATGATVTLSVTVTNTATLPIGYRWRSNSVFVPSLFMVLTQRTAFLTITNVRIPATNWTVVVTNFAWPNGFLSSNAFLTLLADTDGDGLPDAYETAYGFSSTNSLDAALDADGDGVSNLAEHNSGTNPTNAISVLRIDSFATGGGAALSFFAVSNKTYAVHFTEDPAEPWRILEPVAAHRTNRIAVVIDPALTTNRFYRIATPQ